jgi:hypothetical protein
LWVANSIAQFAIEWGHTADTTQTKNRSSERGILHSLTPKT